MRSASSQQMRARLSWRRTPDLARVADDETSTHSLNISAFHGEQSCPVNASYWCIFAIFFFSFLKNQFKIFFWLADFLKMFQ
jgi:hypothetical protein